MVNQMSEEEIYEQAKKRVEEKKRFYSGLAVYVIVNVILVIVWAYPAGGGYPWFLWPLGGWGFFVLLDFLKIFVFTGKGDKAAIEKEADKIRRDTG